MVTFAFTNSTSEQSEADILATLDAITATLNDLRADVKALEPAWVGSESESYYAIAKDFYAGAQQIADILNPIRAALQYSRLNVTEFRNEVSRVLRS